ncbi:hypothetical protein M3Y99_00136800 [Aphelenchoides fujianensis]|nr:hypothetical protein M3Y99_00136800 [Aphelenchoides fujianensis]
MGVGCLSFTLIATGYRPFLPFGADALQNAVMIAAAWVACKYEQKRDAKNTEGSQPVDEEPSEEQKKADEYARAKLCAFRRLLAAPLRAELGIGCMLG